MPEEGVEPSSLAARAPEARAVANFATRARYSIFSAAVGFTLYSYFAFKKPKSWGTSFSGSSKRNAGTFL